LADKTAEVLATSLNQILREVAQTAEMQADGSSAPETIGGSAPETIGSSAQDARPWFVHILVGDGIPTNEAAAKILWAWVKSERLPHRFRYFTLVVKCASHQANLAVASAVTGRAALEGARNTLRLTQGESPLAERALAAGNDSPARGACGAIVRFFKYLVSDYYAEFVSNLQELVGSVRATGRTPGRRRQLDAWVSMEKLYGESVIPPGLLELLNAGLGEWAHCPPAAGAPDSAARAPSEEERMVEVRDSLLELLRKRILVVDEQPTLTRMFTFQKHIECFLLMDFLGCSEQLVKLRRKPNERNGKRSAKVNAVLSHQATPQYLRRTALALQLTGHVNGLCGQLHCDEGPLLVRLAGGVVGRNLDEDLRRLLARLHLDPSLDVGACVSTLLAVAMDLTLRFRQYMAWPYAAYKLCVRFNEHYLAACFDFLQLPEGELDIAFSLPLRQLAQRFGETQAQQIQYLASPSVQNALEQAFRVSAASSLPVERAFAETKRSEAPRLCHVATAGRNQILRQHVRQRQELLQRAEEAAVAVRQAMHTTLMSLAWEIKPDLVAPDHYQAAAVREFIDSHRPQLQAVLSRRRADAAAAAAAARWDTPVSLPEWTQWFRDNEDDFQQRLKSAGQRRRAINRRLVASSAAPAPVRRIGPQRARVDVRQLPFWKQVLWGRCGWHCVVLKRPHGPAEAAARKDIVTVFLYVFQRRTYLLDFRPWRAGSGYTINASDDFFPVSELVAPLADLELEGEVTDIAELLVAAAARPGSVNISSSFASPLDGPLRALSRRNRSAADSSSSSAESRSDVEESDVEEQLHKDARGSSSGSSCPSVDWALTK